MKTPLSRRTVLRGAGVAVPLPFLNLMESRAAEPRDAIGPSRFITLFKPNGVHPPSWNISGGTETDFRMSPLMQPFAHHKDDLLILDNMGDFGFSSHANSTRRFLCGHHGNLQSASIDQLIADKLQGDSPFRSLELTTEGLFPNQIGCSYISYNADGSPIPRESDPQLIFDRLFRSPASDPRRLEHMTSLLDRVREDAARLDRMAGIEDRERLDEYLTVLRESEKRLQKYGDAESRITNTESLQRPPAATNLDQQVESMLDVIELALWTDSTRCITFMLGNSNSRMVFDFLGITEQHHYLSHFFRNFSRQNLEALLRISLWHMEKFDSLLTRLKSRRDRNGSLLDTSLVLFGSGMGHSDNHTVTRIPVILAGGAGALKTGRYVRYSENQRLSKLHHSLLSAFGLESGDYGGSSETLSGLKASDYTPWKDRPFDSWVRVQGNTIQARGRLRMSDSLDDARTFFLDVDGQPPVRVEVEFRDFHRFNLAYHCGTGITIEGEGEVSDNSTVIRKVTAVTSLFGHAPGSKNG